MLRSYADNRSRNRSPELPALSVGNSEFYCRFNRDVSGCGAYGAKSKVLAPPFDDYTDLFLSSMPEMKVGWLEGVIENRRMESADNG